MNCTVNKIRAIITVLALSSSVAFGWGLLGCSGLSPHDFSLFDKRQDPMTFDMSFNYTNNDMSVYDWVVGGTQDVAKLDTGIVWTNANYASINTTAAYWYYDDIAYNNGTVAILWERAGGTNPNRTLFILARASTTVFSSQYYMKLDLAAAENLAWRWVSNFATWPYEATGIPTSPNTKYWTIFRWDQTDVHTVGGTNTYWGVSNYNSSGMLLAHHAGIATNTFKTHPWGADTGHSILYIGGGSGGDIYLYHAFVFNRWLEDEELLGTLPAFEPVR